MKQTISNQDLCYRLLGGRGLIGQLFLTLLSTYVHEKLICAEPKGQKSNMILEMLIGLLWYEFL